MQLTARNTGTWAKIGSRATFGLALAELAKSEDDLMVLTADTSTSAGLERFKKAFPDKFLDVGIAEQNMIGIAAGLASEGFSVVTATFAPFQTFRCCEQIRVSLGYMGQKVVLVGLASGVALGTLGYTHCCIEDVALMRAIPGMVVISPADCGETAKAAAAALDDDRPVYIRLTGGKDNPAVYSDDYDFEIGKGVRLRDGDDVALVAAGTMVHRALGAADALNERGISARVIDMHTIKPLDDDLVAELARTCRLIVTIEEHSVVGGLGSAVADALANLDRTPPLAKLGLPDAFGMTGEYADILDHYGLTAEKIAADVADRHAQL
jgi:transketolase